MSLPGKKSERSMLDGIKSKLGFAGANDQNAGQGRYDDGYDGYDDFGDFDGDGQDYGDLAGYGPDYDDGAASSPYDPYTPVTTRSSRDVTARSRARGDATMPKLVSIDDVRAHTQLPDSLNRDPLPPRHVSSARLGYRGERTMVDSSLPPSLTPEGTAAASAAAMAARRDRSEGLNSLFEPTTEAPEERTPSHAAHASRAASSYGQASSSGAASAYSSGYGSSSAAAAQTTSATTTARGGFDPYEAYAGTGATSFSASRSCSVFKPASYGEVERVAKVLKAGDAVVLVLRNTPDPLAKRILDFSFGVSSALEANVECVGDKVFAITRGGGLTDAERTNLRNQGVL